MMKVVRKASLYYPIGCDGGLVVVVAFNSRRDAATTARENQFRLIIVIGHR